MLDACLEHVLDVQLLLRDWVVIPKYQSGPQPVFQCMVPDHVPNIVFQPFCSDKVVLDTLPTHCPEQQERCQHASAMFAQTGLEQNVAPSQE